MSFLSREATIAKPGRSRWLVPPAAIAVHMCIGQVYGFSVFNKPLSEELGVPVSGVQWGYMIALMMLGISAAVFGKWVERSGPRKTMVASCACFCGGLVLAALGVKLKLLWLILFGYGFVGGIGLGLGYISPVSTLVKWFPDRPGMATGMAIMGFGGGALIGSPLAQELMVLFKSGGNVAWLAPTGGASLDQQVLAMLASPLIGPLNHLATGTTSGAMQTLLTMAGLYSISMLFGALIVRVPAADWKPAGWEPKEHVNPLVTNANVAVDVAWKTPQFWLLWVVLCMNVSAGIGVLGRAADMSMDMFGVSAAIGAGFAGLLSIFNMGGRFVWSSISDFTGRKAVYCIYFVLGGALYAILPWTQQTQSKTIFVIATTIIISMYGAGFATIPAYLRDMFGTYQVGAIHGRLITAWSMAAVIGPSLINGLYDRRVAGGVPKAEAYNNTFYLMIGLLLIGLIANLLVQPVNPKYHVKEDTRTNSV